MSTPHLLLAGTSPAALQQLAEILSGAEYEVVSTTFDQVMDKCRAAVPALIILVDDMQPMGNLISRLKSDRITDQIPILVALTHFTETAATQILGLGADEFLVPPFQPQEVVARVAVLLKLSRDRQLLLTSQEEFTRLFSENPQPLFYCDRQGDQCYLNPSLRNLLGLHDRKRSAPVPLASLFFSEEDKDRFDKLVSGAVSGGPVKVTLRSRTGKPVTVLLADMAPAGSPEPHSFQVQQVGTASPMKRALKTLVENFLPSARDYLALLSMTPLLGGRYEKLKKLGQGSFGEVWLVLDTETISPKRQYVAKIPFTKAANAKFRQEAHICQALAPHPGVVQLVDIVEDEGKIVLIHEYISGQTLADMLGEELPTARVENIIMQLIEVVAHAHERRIMHRDIKPNNIILKEDGTLKLLDYGAAKLLKEKDISATMVGSRPFMAPEQIMGESERRSDIWAIGVTMYLLYAGDLPFYSEVEKLLIDQILEQEPMPPREHNPEIPSALETIILKCLRKKVDERYENALALKADLLRHFPDYGARAASQ